MGPSRIRTASDRADRDAEVTSGTNTSEAMGAEGFASRTRHSCIVLERDLDPESRWKSLPLGRRGLNTLSVEAMHRRGLLSNFVDSAERNSFFTKTPGFQFGGAFAGIMLNLNKVDMTRWKYRLPGPALLPCATSLERIESTLTKRAESLGVTILRGSSVTKIAAQDDNGVAVETGDGKFYRGKWLVGCDEAKFMGYAVECEFDHPEEFEAGFHLTSTGLYIIAPNSMYLVDFDTAAFDRTQDITLEHLQGVLERQATSYRKGRVLLARDAAHIHGPLGAQGLNVGLGDAMNLGWKLAATIQRESASQGSPADLALLDTYETERHPVGAWVLEWTRAQVATTQPDLYGASVQALIRDLINTTDGTSLFIDRIWGLSQRYSLGDGEAHAHPLVGSSVPDFELVDGSRLGSKMEGGRGLLIDFEDDSTLKESVDFERYNSRVDFVKISAKDQCGLRALLVRPDGIVAWVVEAGADADINAAKAALKRWFGSSV
ncbi:hypothetical protein AK830_g5690 [Neonectria ditissima]|uniref:FAD-binding domain-containing protein n=1 Tax=Neonectria ditissima TaxID=78410 RepID=A0A0P7B373_9HYPO|nr:hypothetical protein AK830_g5690 [Neonectria ditissima]